MTIEKISFGLMHPGTGELALQGSAYDDQRVVSVYRSSDHENRHDVFKYYSLTKLQDIIDGVVPLDEDDYRDFLHERDYDGNWPEVESDFTGFVPVAFVERYEKALGLGTPYMVSQEIKSIKINAEVEQGYEF